MYASQTVSYTHLDLIGGGADGGGVHGALVLGVGLLGNDGDLDHQVLQHADQGTGHLNFHLVILNGGAGLQICLLYTSASQGGVPLEMHRFLW